MTKIAILILYLRIAAQRTYRKLIWACMVFVITTAFACVMASTFQCSPIRKAWDAAGTVPGHCINVNALFFANAALDIFQDAVIYILPMKMLYRLQVPKRQKIALMMVFAVGGFVFITGMVRLSSLRVAQNTPDPSCPYFSSPPFCFQPFKPFHPLTQSITDNNFGAAVWSSIECNIGVVCASLPYFKPLIDRFFPSAMGRASGPPIRLTPLRDNAPGEAKRNYRNQADETELEIEHGPGWKDAYTSKYGGENYTCSATAGGGEPPNLFGASTSGEHLRSVEAQGENGGSGIYKSTRVVVSQD